MITERTYPKTQTSKHPYLFPSSQSLDLTRNTYKTFLNLSPFYPYYHYPNSGILYLLTRLLQQSATCSSLSSLHFLWPILLHTLIKTILLNWLKPFLQRFLNAFTIKVQVSKKTVSLDSLHLCFNTINIHTDPPLSSVCLLLLLFLQLAHSQRLILANLYTHHLLFMSPRFLNLVRFLFRSPYAVLYYWTNKMILQLSV